MIKEIFKYSNIDIEMNAETILSKLEQDENKQRFTIDFPIRIPPPSYSSFYWKNNSGKKYKVFIPTEEGKVYWNFEEYDRNDMDFNTVGENWRHAKKCVQIAVSNTPEDKMLNYVMNEALVRSLKKINKDLTCKNKHKVLKHETDLKCYIINKYSVRDIQDVDMKDRYKYAKKSIGLEISLHDEDFQVIDWINYAFYMIAIHFRQSLSRKVHRYYRRNYFN